MFFLSGFKKIISSIGLYLEKRVIVKIFLDRYRINLYFEFYPLTLRNGVSMHKMKFVLGSLFAVSTVLAVADQGQSGGLESAVTVPTSVITPSVAPNVDGAGFVFTADFIWWKAHMGNLSYAGTGVVDGGANVPLGGSTSKGHLKTPEFDFEPGFKVGAGLDFEHDGWDAFAEYTWLNGDKNRSHINARAGLGESSTTTTPTPSGIVTLVPLETASNTWEQSFNVLDTELGRNFFISHRLTLRPFFGLKAAWITEKYNNYFLTTTNTSTALGADSYNIHQKRNQRMWGIGTRAGVDTVWHFSKNWGIYGDLAATAMWGDFHSKAKDTYTNVTTAAVTTNANVKSSITEVNMIFETSLGLTYMTWFNDDSCQFMMKAGWEEQIWFNMNHFTDSIRNGDLTLHGLTVKFGVAF
jgi:hypothetical protein